MFWEIIRFEIQNKLRRPAIYLYLAAVLIFTVMSFATASLPLSEKQHINSPQTIAFWYAAMSMVMMLVGSSVMGMSIYRDIEQNTKDYYLTYPITKFGYFWGRFVSSFLFMVLLGLGLPLGILLGTKLGPFLGREQYGPNLLPYYLEPFLTIVLPNVLFTSCLFYGLVAITRNVKVVYTGGIILFLAYFVSAFFFGHTNNTRVMILCDPFLLTGVRLQMNESPSIVQNTQTIVIAGDNLLNRLIWPGIGLVVVFATYVWFNFETFFSGRKYKSAIDETGNRKKAVFSRASQVSFSGAYDRRTFYNLTRLELANILRDNYFWIIIGLGAVILGFSFWMTPYYYGVENFPRSVDFLADFHDTFIFFVFFIILFYTGETLHRDRLTRYAFVNDSLPPPNWVLNGSKLVSLLIFAGFLALLPLVVGVVVQVCKGYFAFNLPIYLSGIGVQVLPRLLEMVFFCYVVHVVLNNKFAAHGVAAVLWIGGFFLQLTGVFDYHLLVYPYTPGSGMSEMDGLGHMAGPILWFHSYWLLFGGLLVIVAALFFHRGVSSSLKERLQLVPERMNVVTRWFTVGLFLGFFAVGGWLYYNVSFLNDFITKGEGTARGIRYEKTLKHYDSLPLPVVTRLQMQVDLYPEKQQESVRARVTIANLGEKPISQLLLDGDELSEYQLSMDWFPLAFVQPLYYDRGSMNFFRSREDSAPFRLYTLPRPLAPGDTAVVDVRSSVYTRGIPNGQYGQALLRNGVVFKGGLPGAGYDDDDEISSPYERRKYQMPVRKDEDEIPQNDPVGIRTLKAGRTAHLMTMDVTVSTSGDQVAVGQGELVGQWKHQGRNFFHYVLDRPGTYPPTALLSARYAVAADSLLLDHKIKINVFYHPAHGVNVQRFIAAYKDALRYYSEAYGPYPYNSISLAETSPYMDQQGSMATLNTLPENFGWNAHFTNPDQFDYCYYVVARLLSQQWWRYQVAPNETVGSLNIPEGLAYYDALVMTEHKYGKDNMKWILQQQEWPYLFLRTRREEIDMPLIRSKFWFVTNGKGSVVLYGLRDLIGEDSINAALREFKDSFSCRSSGPYAGANDLYRCLKAHTPDSLQYYLSDTWEKVTLYDNSLTSVAATPTGRPDEYKVVLTVNAGKVWIGEKGQETVASGMADYIDIGVFGSSTTDKTTGRGQTNPLYLQRYKLTAGSHVITVIVHGKPEWAGIDPYSKLLDRRMGDNTKSFTK